MTLYTNDLVLDEPNQLKALADETRAKMLRILEDGPASAKQLSILLEMSHGKVGHHMKVLRDAGLIEVVEERPVRAVTERFYGLTYDRLRFAASEDDRLGFLFAQASREARPASEQPFDPPGILLTVRMSDERAAEFHQRITELAEEFANSGEVGADEVYGVAASVFVTDTPRTQT
jgi:DNA-binding transcriptional ArsR family regulator